MLPKSEVNQDLASTRIIPCKSVNSVQLEPGQKSCHETVRVADTKLSKLNLDLARTYRVNIWFLNCILTRKNSHFDLVSPTCYQYRFIYEEKSDAAFDSETKSRFLKLDKADKNWTAFKMDAFTTEVVAYGLELWLSSKEELCKFVLFLLGLRRFSSPFKKILQRKNKFT